jgi:RNA polymerase sigma factor (sigma-70 family)
VDTERTKTPQATAQQVDEAARLFAGHQSFIQATIRYLTKDTQEQVDFYQDLFIYFIRKPVPADVHRINAFLYRVILDRFRDRKRRQSSYRKRIGAYAQVCFEQPKEPDSPPPDPEEMAALFELIEKRLRKTEAEAVLYKYKEDLDVEDIAQRMNVDAGTVKHYLSVGLKKLRTILAKDNRYR